MDIGSLTGSISIEDQLSGALTIAADQVKKFADGFDGMIGIVAIGASLAVTAISAVTAAVTARGMHGSEVNDVTAGFDRLSGSVENATAILDAMRTGVAGTIS